MSKMDGLRAMREARYARGAARGATSTATPATAPKKASRPARKAAEPAPATDEPDARLCGHRAISGRTCTREHGHAAKSHRYA